jgi:hypothetical protein
MLKTTLKREREKLLFSSRLSKARLLFHYYSQSGLDSNWPLLSFEVQIEKEIQLNSHVVVRVPSSGYHHQAKRKKGRQGAEIWLE